jgi:4-aminobutyrate aminotransferase-like enzyme
MVGLELRTHEGAPATAAALHLIKEMLRMGYILLPEGEHSNVLGFTPPLTISEAQLKRAVRALAEALQDIP